MATPGTYSVQLTLKVDGRVAALGSPESFQTTPLGLATLAAEDQQAVLTFQRQVGNLQRAVMGTAELARERARQLELAAAAASQTPGIGEDQAEAIRAMQLRLFDIEAVLWGDRTIARRSEPTLPGLVRRVDRAVGGFWSSSAPTETHRREYSVAVTMFTDLLARFEQFEDDFAALQETLDEQGAPWTPGRGLPEWQPD